MFLAKSNSFLLLLVSIGWYGISTFALEQPQRRHHKPSMPQSQVFSRREALGCIVSFGGAVASSLSPVSASPAWAASAVQDSMDVDNFLRTGVDGGGNMGVSSQAGKSKPETGVFLRDGSDVSRNPRTGDVLAEILLQDTNGERMAALASFSCPWPVAKGSFFDVECRNSDGDSAFLAVTTSVNGQSIENLKDSFFLENLLSPTGRFSFYGQPTDVKVKKSTQKDGYRIMDIAFATLSQSTNTEIPRKARLVAAIPAGSNQAVMLVGSASSSRWAKGADKNVISTVDSFKAVAAPKTSMKLRKKERQDTFGLE